MPTEPSVPNARLRFCLASRSWRSNNAASLASAPSGSITSHSRRRNRATSLGSNSRHHAMSWRSASARGFEPMLDGSASITRTIASTWARLRSPAANASRVSSNGPANSAATVTCCFAAAGVRFSSRRNQVCVDVAPERSAVWRRSASATSRNDSSANRDSSRWQSLVSSASSASGSDHTVDSVTASMAA